MKIKDLFKQDISRDINGVIKVDQRDEEVLKQELEEYVITNELKKHFKTFFEAYSSSFEQPTDKIGVWISGFFGSGKSHFLKMISYLFSQETIDGKKAIDYFEPKFSDALSFSLIKDSVSKFKVDPILFNIDSIADSDNKQKSETIVRVLLKAFNKYQGYCAETPWVADIERALDQQGLYEEFKKKYKELAEVDWKSDRAMIFFNKGNMIKAVSKVKKNSEEGIKSWVEKEGKDFTISSNKFAEMIHHYLETKENQRIIFLIDEVGQYIGDDSNLMLNLQTVTEDLGRKCHGKAWIAVTAQEAIDKITQNTIAGHDFSKIRGRFSTQISLTSENTDAVIKKRLLEKDEQVNKRLTEYYTANKAKLGNTVTFSAGTAGMRGFEDQKEFAEVYPFIPYQFNLLQKVFEMVRKIGATGAHLSEGERSMLSAFQEAAKQIANQEVSSLVSFDKFYQSITTFLRQDVRRTINKAHDNPNLEKDDVNILQILFMIKYIKEIKPTLENITTLYVKEVDQDKLRLTDKIRESLVRLKAETLIKKTAQEYEFLTDAEQDISKQIKSVSVDFQEIVSYYAKIIFDEIYPDKKYLQFNFNKIVDFSHKSDKNHEISLKVTTPLSEEYGEDHDQVAFQYGKEDEALIVLPENEQLRDIVKDVIQTSKYIKTNTTTRNSDTVRDIISNRKMELDTQKQRIREMLREDLLKASYFLNQRELKITGNTPKNKISAALEKLVEDAYSKLGYIEKHYQKLSDVTKVLRSNDIQQETLIDANSNQIALDEIINSLQTKEKRSIPVSLKSVKNEFTKKPYGWAEMDINGLVAELLVSKQILIELKQEQLTPNQEKTLEVLSKANLAEKAVIRLRKQIDQTTINKVRNILLNVFDKSDAPSDEDKLYSETASLLENEIEKLSHVLERYKYDKYPGKIKLETLDQKLMNIGQIQNRKRLFKSLREAEEELKEMKRKTEPVIAFFNSQQVEIFDEALKEVGKYKDDEQYLPEESQAQLLEMEQIINNDEPYGEINRLKQLKSDIASKHSKKILKKKNELTEKAQHLAEELRLEYSNLEEKTLEQQLKRLNRVKVKIEQADTLVKLAGLEAQLDNEYKSVINYLEKEKEKKDGGEKKVTTEAISSGTLLKWDKSLNTEQEVEEYINEIRKKLMAKINQGKKIKIL
ncbi:MAG: BREX system P-loop protein BrxC [Patescibacteria group bacterium]|nr:BREX system P-loop protein BrxC [Patescibacteria group bacterium]